MFEGEYVGYVGDDVGDHVEVISVGLNVGAFVV
jgi:hypothetical protein